MALLNLTELLSSLKSFELEVTSFISKTASTKKDNCHISNDEKERIYSLLSELSGLLLEIQKREERSDSKTSKTQKIKMEVEESDGDVEFYVEPQSQEDDSYEPTASDAKERVSGLQRVESGRRSTRLAATKASKNLRNTSESSEEENDNLSKSETSTDDDFPEIFPDSDLSDYEHSDQKKETRSRKRKRRDGPNIKSKVTLTPEISQFNDEVKKFLANGVAKLLTPPYSCPYCEKGFTTKGKLREHLPTHIQGEYSSCPVCRKEVRSHILRDHVQIRHKPEYEEIYGDLRKIKPHKPEDFGWTEQDIENPGNTSEPFKCPICAKPAKKRGQALLHADTHKVDYLQQLCPICGKCVKALDVHIYTFHPNQEGNQAPLEDFTCPYPACGKKYTSLYQLKIHLRGAHRSVDIAISQGKEITEVEKDFMKKREEIIGTAIKRAVNMEQNTRLKQLHPCKDCDKVFAKKQLLDSHLWVHDKSLMVDCPFPGCSKKISSKRKLKRHLQTHGK